MPTDLPNMTKELIWAECVDFSPHITPTKIHGACIIARPRHNDARGSFQEIWTMTDIEEIARCQVVFRQGNLSVTVAKDKPVFRGFHAEPQWKIISPIKGELLAMIVDLRPDSQTFMTNDFLHFNLKKPTQQRYALVLPPGVANAVFVHSGKPKRSNVVEYFYTVSEEYDSKYSGVGVSLKDTRFTSLLPTQDVLVSERDEHLPGLEEFLSLNAHLLELTQTI